MTACPEFHELASGITRRNFVKTVMALGGGVMLSSVDGLSVTSAAIGDARSDVIITVYMRGGMDGLLAVPVLGDPTLAKLRPTQRTRDADNLSLDGYFGLHPKLTMLKELYDQGQMAVIQAVGTPVGTRSHFDDQRALEYAAYDNPGTTDGWQNRYLQAMGATDVFSGYSTGFQTPTALRGSVETTVFESFNSVTLAKAGNFTNRDNLIAALKNLHSDGASNWQVAAQHSLVASERLRSVAGTTPAIYPGTTNGRRFSALAAMMKNGLGIKTANLEFDGEFDIHSDAGVVDGNMATNFQSLSDCVRAFKQDIGDLWNNVTIVTVTEFGRRLEQNASNGFDHGWASAMFVMGGGVRGGQVVTKWPGLTDTRDGDLKVTTDYRTVLAEVMKVRGGMPADKISQILPGFQAQDLGIVKPLV